MIKGKHIIILGMLFTVFLVSCGSHENEHHTVMDKIIEESKHYNGVSISSEKHTASIKKIQITEGQDTFFIPERKWLIKSFECSECHTVPLNKMKDLPGGKKAHWNIKMNHAGTETMNCETCHNGHDMDLLKTVTNQDVDFNLSYKVCSQCHSDQFKDWKGGAHGKRLGGWAPPRVSNTCVNCHNPHDPHIKSKWPVRYNTQIEQERN